MTEGMAIFRSVKGASVVSAALIWGSLACPSYSNPSGESVVSGGVNFQRDASTLTVTQGTTRAIVNWADFSIAQGELTKFIQPNSTSAILNRVTSGNPSSILGSLQSNGQVFLINSNGILVGSGATINCGSFIASTHDVSNSEFLSGGDMNFIGSSTASIQNLGTIRASTGDVVLIAREIKNSGTIQAPNGTAALAGGTEVLLKTVGTDKVYIQAGSTAGSVTSSGVIEGARAELKAAGGNAYALAINNSGKVAATGIVQGANGTIQLVANSGTVKNSGTITSRNADGSGGKVVLQTATQTSAVETPENLVDHSGVIDVSSTVSGKMGGEVNIFGENISLADTAVINAFGTAGGGLIYIGGGWQGKNSAFPNSNHVYVAKGAIIDASATENGNGGTVVFWSNNENIFHGTVYAKGGAQGGNGGNVEVSGKKSLVYQGLANTLAPKGQIGNLLLDPTSINIKDGAGTDTANAVYEQNLEAQLSNITLQTDATSSGNITLENLSDNLLELQPGVTLNIKVGDYFSGGYGSYTTQDNNDEIRVSGSGDVIIQAAMSVSVGKITATGTGKIRLFGDNGLNVYNSLTTNGGIIELWADSDNLGGGLLTLNQPINSNGGAIYLDSGTSGIVINNTITTGAGRIYFDTFGTVRNFNITLNAPIISTGDVTMSNNLTIGTGGALTTTGTIAVTGTITMSNGGSLTLRSAGVDFSSATFNSASQGTLTLEPYSATSNILVNGSDGAGGAYDLPSATLTKIAAFGKLIVGRTDGSGAISLSSAISTSFANGLEFRAGTIDLTTYTLTNAGDITLTGDSINLSQQVNAGTHAVTIRQQTAANTLSVGTGTGFDQSASSLVTAGTLIVGRSDGGAVTIASDVVTSATTTHILSASSITGTAGSISSANLALTAGGAITLNASSLNLSSLAISAAGQSVTIVNGSGALSLGTVDGVVGVTVGSLSLTTGGAITQSSKLVATGTVSLSSGGSITLNNASNTIAALGNITRGGALDLFSAGSALAINGSINNNSGAVTIRNTGGNMTIGSGAQISSGASGNAIVLSTSGNFINNSGANALSLTGSGRFLVYANSHTGSTLGGLSGSNKFATTYAGLPPGSVTQTGNVFLFTTTPTLTLTAVDASRSPNAANPSFTYTVSGLVGSDTAGAAISGTPTYTASTTSTPGQYTITISLGSLSSPLGYNFAFQGGTLTVVDNAASYLGNSYEIVSLPNGNLAKSGGLSVITVGSTIVLEENNQRTNVGLNQILSSHMGGQLGSEGAGVQVSSSYVGVSSGTGNRGSAQGSGSTTTTITGRTTDLGGYRVAFQSNQGTGSVRSEGGGVGNTIVSYSSYDSFAEDRRGGRGN